MKKNYVKIQNTENGILILRIIMLGIGDIILLHRRKNAQYKKIDGHVRSIDSNCNANIHNRNSMSENRKHGTTETARHI